MMFTRDFTLAEANALVPLLQETLTAAHTQLQQAKALHQEIESAQASAALGVSATTENAQAALARLEIGIAELLAHVSLWGVSIRAIDPPVVEASARMHGMPVMLTWKLGEPAFTHWHASDESFAARRPIEEGDDFGTPLVH